MDPKKCLLNTSYPCRATVAPTEPFHGVWCSGEDNQLTTGRKNKKSPTELATRAIRNIEMLW